MYNSIVEMRGITKRFQNEVVLDSVDFCLERGEIHGLIGENGAGKSTLMKILAGVYKPDKGEIFIEGNKVEINEPKVSQTYGITTIYQDVKLADELSIAENIFFGSLPTKGKLMRTVDWDKIHNDSKKILDSLNFMLDVKIPVKELSSGQKQMVEIAKALTRKSRVIIMDEPYTGISDQELEQFFCIIRSLKAEGVSIIYISHRMKDILQLCDSITVLRGGKVVENREVKGVDGKDIIRMMIGNELKDNYPKLNSKAGRILLKVKSISTERGLKRLSFNLRKGEILGVAGLLGSGRSAIARALFGLDKLLAGEIYLNDTKIDIKSPHSAINMKIGYLVEDRMKGGVHKYFNIPENISLASLSKISKIGLLDTPRERDVARSFIKKFMIKTPKVEQNIMELSGGNQQKVLLCRWIFSDTNILILDEPTKGIDKSTKVELYNFMNKYVMDGSSIIFVSSDLNELMGMSERILVLYNGEIRRTLIREEFSEEKIIYYASGGED